MSKASLNQILDNLLINKNSTLSGKRSIESGVNISNDLSLELENEISALIKDNLNQNDVTVITEPQKNIENINISNKNKLLDSHTENGIFTNLSNEEIKEIASTLYNSQKELSVESTIESSEEISEEPSVADAADAESDPTTFEGILNIISNSIDKFGDAVKNQANAIADTLSGLREYMTGGDSGTNTLIGTLGGIMSVISDNLRAYQDGVSETEFGSKMENSWQGSATKSFLNYFENENKKIKEESERKINFLTSNPLDSGPEKTSIYGSMMLGTPYLFNNLADPTNRTLINTLVKDARYVSFTPGMPKFNGTSYSAAPKNNILNQTKAPTQMLQYLTKNGLDADFYDKDKRYYTFKTDYKLYFSYLETMLNALWVKMGLAKNGETFNLFTFFNISGNETGVNSKGYSDLMPRYNSSIGFFTSMSNGVSESVSNGVGGEGDSLAARANTNASEYRSINYLTGMGTGGGLQDAARTAGIMTKSVSNLGNLLSETFGGTIDALSNVQAFGGGIQGAISAALSIAKVPIAVASDISTFTSTNDLGALIQSFATANGMQVSYPNLWDNSSFSKSVSLEFNFTSPYGDPLSIFKYVYVPFCALLCFGMPRQAGENGLVSPFLVRCESPGVFSSDMALISDISWTRGGGASAWTKDGLPRSINVQVTLQDLYPYLSMTKRLSFLSANPSYAVFLDSFSGMLALNDTNDEDGLNTYFKTLINRVNGESKDQSMWNQFHSKKSKATIDISKKIRQSISATVDEHAIPWMHNSSISK